MESPLWKSSRKLPRRHALHSELKRPESLRLPVPERDGYRFELDVPVPMRDGTFLATDLYLPVQPGAYPVLLERTPYGKHSSVMVNIGAPQNLARNGYVVAIQDTRGRFASEGDWYPFRDEAHGERQDGHDTVEWLAAQPFSTGRIGTFGGSYAGFNQYTLAGAMPPHLAATFPRQAPCSLRREWVYRGGAVELAFIVFRWARRMFSESLRNRASQYERRAVAAPGQVTNGWPLPGHFLLSDPYQWLKDYFQNQENEEYWKQWDIAPHHESFDRPSFHVGSWFDIFCGGTLANFQGMRAKARSEKVRRAHRLVIGPWIHGPFMYREPEGRRSGEMDFGPNALWDYNAAMLRWFDRWLKNKNNGVMDEPAVKYFVMGLNEWKTAEDWPPPGMQAQRYYLHRERSGSAGSTNDGSLVQGAAAADCEIGAYVHDPDYPVPSIGGATLFTISRAEAEQAESWEDINAQAGSRDQRLIEPLCLTFTSPVLTEPLEIAGPVNAVLRISSDAVDTDFVVRLSDVYPDGRSMLICDGIQRVRYRLSDFSPSLMRPGEIYTVTVDMWATANLFLPGHRVRLIVNSSCYPRWDVNPGTGESSLLTCCEKTRTKSPVWRILH